MPPKTRKRIAKMASLAAKAKRLRQLEVTLPVSLTEEAESSDIITVPAGHDARSTIRTAMDRPNTKQGG